MRECKFESAKPKEKQYKVHDVGGLFLHVLPSGTKVWRLNYRMNGKYQTKTIGRYDLFTVDDARARSRIVSLEVMKEKQGLKDSNYADVSELDHRLADLIVEKLYKKIGDRLAALEESLCLIDSSKDIF